MIYVLYESQICLHHEKGQTCCFSSVLLFLVCKNFCALCPLQLLEGKQRSTVLFSRVLEVSASYTNRAGQTENFSSMSSMQKPSIVSFCPQTFRRGQMYYKVPLFFVRAFLGVLHIDTYNKRQGVMTSQPN